MNDKYLSKLLSISSDDISKDKVKISAGKPSKLNELISKVLSLKNGFFAFENALEIYPLKCSQNNLDVEVINNSVDWASVYGLESDAIIFGQDLFGFQFFISSKRIGHLNTEDGAVQLMGASFEDWARAILQDYDYLTGWSIAHDWQVKNGVLEKGTRLYPKIPFILGGKYAMDNLYLNKTVDGIKFRVDLFNQIKNLKDGTEVDIKILRSSPTS